MVRISSLAEAVYTDGRAQGEIARLAGISEATLSRITQGHATPQHKTLFRLARVLNTTPELLVADAVQMGGVL